jgi:hypothetical protein
MQAAVRNAGSTNDRPHVKSLILTSFAAADISWIGWPCRGAGEIFSQVEPEDLLKYGLIPECVGRLPVVATLGDLDELAHAHPGRA